MESAIALAVLLLIAVVIGSIFGWIAFFRTRKLAQQLLLLRQKLKRLEMQAEGSGADAPPATEPFKKAGTAPEDIADDDEAKSSADVSSMPSSAPDTDPEFVPQPAIAASVEAASVSERASPNGGLENALGGKWAVWVGGIALAFGAIFLVRYSIEQGLLDAKTRLLLGFLFSAALVGLGEWTRRHGSFFSVPGYERANIPATLTAAGTIGAFASMYVAYGVYGFIGPAVAFIGLGIVAVGTLCAALLHGPALAALGLLGAYAAPFMVSTQEPVPWTLALYALFVSAAAYTVARWRLWRWLAISAAVGLIGFALVLHMIGHDLTHLTIDLYLLVAFATTAWVFVISHYPRDPSQDDGIDWVATLVLGGLMLTCLPLARWDNVTMLAAIEIGVVLAAGFALGAFYPAVRWLIPVGAFLAVMRYLAFDISWDRMQALSRDTEAFEFEKVAFLLSVENVPGFLTLGALLALASLGFSVWLVRQATARTVLASSSTALALLLLVAAWLRVSQFAQSFTFFLLALALVGCFAAIAVYLLRQEDIWDDFHATEAPLAVYTLGAFASLALSASIVLEKGFLTIAIALVVLAMAYVYSRRPLPGFRVAAVVLMVIWCVRVLFEPRIVAGDLGTTPIFNWLLYGWGGSSMAFVGACWFFGNKPRDRWLSIIEGITIAIVTITLAILLIHAWDPAEVFTEFDTLAEAAFVTLSGVGVALGLLHIRKDSGSTANIAIDVLGYGGMAVAVLTLVFAFNPVMTGDNVGQGYIFNAITLGYLLPALLFALLAWSARKTRPHPYGTAAWATSGILGFVWISLVIRHAWHPFDLSSSAMPDAELYTYSIVWLLLGIGLLAVGIFLQARMLRLVSAGLIVLVVVKVFLIDMASLTGILRALSFIGLGLVLVSVGLVYQRLLRPSEAEVVENDHE